ncbi:Defender against death DAD protein [Ascosphaera apis ARSEF 7405]|uniref:Dolichyl-diphosphooligosaccharide--protein glycosyltransferase subunit OST2 n=1 Tax=Ascosphaera apis ARSEF 7405 TaxID=392613 RepID=A0A162I2N2_9EURO|nr:Defender against death DAD protein [Ascosphaera apis ARSEF 7405]
MYEVVPPESGLIPFNAFLSGFGAAVGQFVLTVSLRMQIAESPRKGTKSVVKSTDPEETPSVSSERAFADYIFGSVILHFFCVNFLN